MSIKMMLQNVCDSLKCCSYIVDYFRDNCTAWAVHTFMQYKVQTCSVNVMNKCSIKVM